MSAPVAVQQREPVGEETLTTLLAALRAWTPLDGGALLDDVGKVLDDVVPGEEQVEELAERLRGHLMRLVDVALANEAGEDDQAAELIARARDVRSEEVPGDHWRAVGHLRRMAWVVNELLERLGAIRCLKEYA
ncbi:DUF6415 family natural product biosynthesis protein [Streptomyces olindensis]|uniref:DUF6415 family natural product biosynthesis protein n=1 Tax=Streptomyces olindensis TaxID=358823 RepID=A0ABV2XLL8_9ACTN